MTVKNWSEARMRLLERHPEYEGDIVQRLWERNGGSFAFAIRSRLGHVAIVWVGPRGGVSTSLRYRNSDWRDVVEALT